jgi:hypothetical protein
VLSVETASALVDRAVAQGLATVIALRDEEANSDSDSD